MTASLCTLLTMELQVCILLHIHAHDSRAVLSAEAQWLFDLSFSVVAGMLKHLLCKGLCLSACCCHRYPGHAQWGVLVR